MQTNINKVEKFSSSSCSRWRIKSLGAKLDQEGCYFSVFSSGAKMVELCLFDQQEKEIDRHLLTVMCGCDWQIYIKGVRAGQKYGYRIHGEYNPEQGLLYNPNNLLIDPYAKGLSCVQVSFTQSQDDPDEAMIAKSVVIDDNAFNWENTSKPLISDKDRILYEVHVKGFSQLNKKIPQAKRGKYLGLSDPISIDHYKKLGITSLQIMPVFSFMSEPRLEDLNLTNYWGYNPINFFSPDNRYAQSDAVSEFKQMVKELHANDIEVIIDVVYNHSAEGGFGGQILSLKGFDNRHYYTFEDNTDGNGKDYKLYSNHSGCGNTINNNSPWMLRMTLDSLRYWLEEMHVDGFRFDLAVTLAREENGFNEQSAFLKAVSQDPILNESVLIAEAWDIGPDGYRVGGFPGLWLECNDRFRDISRAFWRGDQDHISEMATRLLGSRDLFAENYRTSSTSVNYICYHDGFTLDDLVSFESRHNEGNAENNRDGHGNNLSSNFGIEGKTLNVKINALREKQKRNFIALLFLSQGTPHFLAGDEMGNSQAGNNNSYCQDNEISWLSWQPSLDDKKLFDFTCAIIKLRKNSQLFSDIYLDGNCTKSTSDIANVTWYHPNGHVMKMADWHDNSAQVISVGLEGMGEIDEHWLLMMNASKYNISTTIPTLDSQYAWEVVINTRSSDNEIKNRDSYLKSKSMTLDSRSLILLQRKTIK
ncbi:MAG: glycogen debranching protein GlgX [Psychromonas sp.]|nr:glycogen debranching protein GlgX [Psychromonas sp.]